MSLFVDAMALNNCASDHVGRRQACIAAESLPGDGSGAACFGGAIALTSTGRRTGSSCASDGSMTQPSPLGILARLACFALPRHLNQTDSSANSTRKHFWLTPILLGVPKMFGMTLLMFNDTRR